MDIASCSNSGISLLKTFINAGNLDAKMVGNKMVMWQIIIHLTFVFSAIALARIDRLTLKTVAAPH